jgi:hypothetical protein
MTLASNQGPCTKVPYLGHSSREHKTRNGVFYLCNINIGSETIEELLPLVGANDISGGPRFWRSRVST